MNVQSKSEDEKPFWEKQDYIRYLLKSNTPGRINEYIYDALKITIEFATQARWIMIFITSNMMQFFAWV